MDGAELLLEVKDKNLLNLSYYHSAIYLYREKDRYMGFPGWSVVKILPTMQETRVRSLGQEDLLEKERATHSSILVGKIPWDREAW